MFIIPKNSKLIPEYAERVFEGVIFDTYQWQQKLFDGSYATFEMLKRPDTVEVLAVKDNKIVLVKEEQPNLGSFFSLPGGMHDFEEESELGAAKRELMEETGLLFDSWKLLSVNQPNSKIDHFIYIFLATNLIDEVAPSLDAGEKIEVNYIEFEYLKNMIGRPSVRSLPERLLNSVDSLEELLDLPEYK